MCETYNGEINYDKKTPGLSHCLGPILSRSNLADLARFLLRSVVVLCMDENMGFLLEGSEGTPSEKMFLVLVRWSAGAGEPGMVGRIPVWATGDGVLLGVRVL